MNTHPPPVNVGNCHRLQGLNRERLKALTASIWKNSFKRRRFETCRNASAQKSGSGLTNLAGMNKAAETAGISK